jgi:hypothetical protein
MLSLPFAICEIKCACMLHNFAYFYIMRSKKKNNVENCHMFLTMSFQGLRTKKYFRSDFIFLQVTRVDDVEITFSYRSLCALIRSDKMPFQFLSAFNFSWDEIRDYTLICIGICFRTSEFFRKA